METIQSISQETIETIINAAQAEAARYGALPVGTVLTLSETQDATVEYTFGENGTVAQVVITVKQNG